MCGVAAIFSYNGASDVSEREITAMRDRMRRRGPDGEGLWIQERIALAHTRLSVIDPSEAASQPMIEKSRNNAIVFNGEIYNYRELKKRLEKQGYVFASNSDTEVLLHLYREEGTQMVEQIRGMFAFVIWDADKEMLICARDPYGIKPLYFCDDGACLRIASQVKALQAGGTPSDELNPAGVCGFFLFGHVPEPYTCYREIQALPAGSWLRCSVGGKPEIRVYFSIAEIYRRAHLGEQRSWDTRLVVDALRDSVAQHMTADVPVGVYLSAGLDSGAVLGMMRDVHSDSIDTFTLTFDEYKGRDDDEGPLAGAVARRYNAQHVMHRYSSLDIEKLIPDFFDAMDQPSIDGLNTWLLSRVVHKYGLKVVLSGLGGDELLGGYPTFTDVPRCARTLAVANRSSTLRAMSRSTIRLLRRCGAALHPKMEGLMLFGGTYAGVYLLRRGLFMPWELQSVLGPDITEPGLDALAPLGHLEMGIDPDPGTHFGRVAALESTFYLRNQLLRDSDWAGMAHSVEIRTPFVDAMLLNKLAPILVSRRGPGDCKDLLADAPAQALPREVKARKKTGFNVPLANSLASIPALGGWRRLPMLSDHRCPWARRWAHAVFSNVVQTPVY